MVIIKYVQINVYNKDIHVVKTINFYNGLFVCSKCCKIAESGVKHQKIM